MMKAPLRLVGRSRPCVAGVEESPHSKERGVG